MCTRFSFIFAAFAVLVAACASPSPDPVTPASTESSRYGLNAERPVPQATEEPATEPAPAPQTDPATDPPKKPGGQPVVPPATLPGCAHPAVMNDMGPPGECSNPGHCEDKTYPWGIPCPLDKCFAPPMHVCSALFGSSISLYCKPDGTLCCQLPIGCPPCGWVACSTSGTYHDNRCPEPGTPYYATIASVKNQPAECAGLWPSTPENMHSIWCMDDYPDWCSETYHGNDTPTFFPEGVVPIWMQGEQAP